MPKCFEFEFLEDVQAIDDVLVERLPKSANVFNMAKVYDNFKKPEEMAFYVMMTSPFSPDESLDLEEENCWILATYYRDDYGMRYAISAPADPMITSEVKNAFVQCPFIDWNASYHFASISTDVSGMIWEISTKVFGNYVTTMPAKVFTISTDQAVNIDLENEQALQLKPMDPVEGAKFITSTWRYSLAEKTQAAAEKLIKKNQSSMALTDEEGTIICGMVMNDCGLMGMLHTVPEHRRKGYATLVTKALMKSFAENYGGFPCSGVEVRNLKSVAFHEKLGMTFSHFADFIKYAPQSWD